jgi:hypothetical protein
MYFLLFPLWLSSQNPWGRSLVFQHRPRSPRTNAAIRDVYVELTVGTFTYETESAHNKPDLEK